MANPLLIKAFLVIGGSIVIGPLALFCLFPGLLRARFARGPEALETDVPPAAQPLVADLKGMQFEALGLKTEQTPLRPPVRELAFVSADRRCYASIGLGSTGPRPYYYTPLPEGGFVLSSNGAFPAVRTASVFQQSYPGCGVRELLERHTRALAELGRSGEVIPTAEARIEATYAYYRTPEVRRVLRRTGLMLLVSAGVMGWILVR